MTTEGFLATAKRLTTLPSRDTQQINTVGRTEDVLIKVLIATRKQRVIRTLQLFETSAADQRLFVHDMGSQLGNANIYQIIVIIAY